MGWFKEVFDDALGIVDTPKKQKTQPVITAEDIVKASIEQGVLKPVEEPKMEPIPLATFDTLFPVDEVPKVQLVGHETQGPAAAPWLLLGLGALWYMSRGKKG